jgi:hypothetical protein
MNQLLRKVTLLTCFLYPWILPCVRAESPVSAVSIPYRDIGPKFYVEGRFGSLYTELTIKAVVVKPPSKRDKRDDDKFVWLNITHIDGKALNPMLSGEVVYSDSKFAEGTEVELVIREEGRLESGDSIDLILNNPNRTTDSKMVCILSLHQRRIVTPAQPK